MAVVLSLGAQNGLGQTNDPLTALLAAGELEVEAVAMTPSVIVPEPAPRAASWLLMGWGAVAVTLGFKMRRQNNPYRGKTRMGR